MATAPKRQYTNPLIRWIEYRLPIFSAVEATIGADQPTPKNLNYWWSFGGLLTVVLVLQIVTGIILAMHYVPHGTMAFDSVEHIMRNVNQGWLMRYMHSNGASLFFAAVYIHMGRGMYYGSYKAPRELLWIIGVVIFLIMMATAFMGYVLPWGQMSFWAATVITNLFSAIPVVGEAITTWLWGGFSVDSPTLQRFYSLHYLLPFVIFGITLLHIWALHVHGPNNPIGIDVKGPQDTLPYRPYYTSKYLSVISTFALILALLVFYEPNYLGHPDNYKPANPLQTPPHIVPEWYFLPFYAILRSIPDKLLGVIAMLASIAVWALLPWLDTSRVRSGRFRPVFKQFIWILAIDFGVLGWVGSQPAEGSALLIGRIATAYYFVHFIFILPLVGWFERPKPLPDSISAAVLPGGGAAAPKAAE
ncbi:MAG: cytochrome b [Alphaproteobacteria bacterium]|nr:cytochrome b [Alphaproteobacteria bacterium]